MTNLIQNSNWQQVGTGGGPANFSGTGPVTFDNFCFEGNRTCSVTMSEGTASDNYDIPLSVQGCCAIRFGYLIRAVEAQSIVLQVIFKDTAGKVIRTDTAPITNCVAYNFEFHEAQFLVPPDAANAMLSLQFKGKVTACTFGAPYALYA